MKRRRHPMKIHNLTVLGFLIGILIGAASFVRWWILWHDLSQFLFGVSISLLIIILSYIHNWMRETDATLNNHYHRLEAMAARVFHVEDEHIDNEIRGKE